MDKYKDSTILTNEQTGARHMSNKKRKSESSSKTEGAEPDHKHKEDYPIDPYTGEPEPLAEDAGKIVELIPSDTGSRSGDDYLLEEETALDNVALDAQTDAIAEQINRYTEDETVEETFRERQKLSSGGRQQLKQKLENYHSKDPDLAAGDLDAAWEDASVAGDEGVGGSVSTPDKDVVDELGEGLGITYEDDEVLRGDEKLRARDRNRWELNPESAADSDESQEE
jgi:hypothetical protein